MNWFAHDASALAFAGVHGSTVDNLVDAALASDSAASWTLVASRVAIVVGWRNGKPLLLRSSVSPGRSPGARLVSPRRARTVLRYSGAVNGGRGRGPAAFGSAVVVPPVPDPMVVPPVP